MSNNSPGSSKFLWFFTGVLITFFACGLLFLKKRITVIKEPQTEAIVITNTAQPPKTNTSKALEATAPNEHDQYDFYTMLPKMQVKQALPPASPATAPAPPKPTKPLAAAEQSMLSPQQTNNNTAVITTAAPTPTSVPTPPPPPSKFIIVAGTFDDHAGADALKAQLLLSGVDQIKIQNVTQNGATKYRVVIGGIYTSKLEAKKALQQLQANGVSGKILGHVPEI